MAISITQRPADHNLVVKHNVWTLSGLTTEDQYVLRVWKPLSTLITTIKQPANPAGVAHFDISKILQSQLSSTWVEDTQKLSETPGESFQYFIQYGTETNGVITIEGNSIPPYDPEEEFPRFNVVYNGYNSWRELNWDSTDFIPEPAPEGCGAEVETNGNYSRQYNFLTNYPNSSYNLRSSTYHTLGFINRIKNWDDGTDWQLGIQPAYVEIKMYNGADELVQTILYSIDASNGLGPKPDYNSTSVGVYEDPQYVGVVGVGPQNLKDAGFWPTLPDAVWNEITQTWGNYSVIWNLAEAQSRIAYYDVKIYSMNMCIIGADGYPTSEDASVLQNYLGDVIYSTRFVIEDPCLKFDPVTVSFVNQYGVKDYFTFDRRNTLSVNTNRNNYYKDNPTWSSTTFSIDQHSGGQTQFSSEIVTNMTMSSYWMNDATSKWLEELFISPSIQVYYDGVWEPAIITSNTYQQKTSSRDKLFQHTLNIQFANNKQTQRG